MKVDPNNHCSKYKQTLVWALIHDIIAHPLMAITGYSKLSLRLHDYTSRRAWKR